MIDQILTSMILDQALQLAQEYYLLYVAITAWVLFETWGWSPPQPDTNACVNQKVQ